MKENEGKSHGRLFSRDIEGTTFKSLPVSEASFMCLELLEPAAYSYYSLTRPSTRFCSHEMSAVSKSLEDVRAVILSAHEKVTAEEKATFYNRWAQTYDQDVTAIEYQAPRLAADSIAAHFSGDRERAQVLDVACGTGLVARQLKGHGFGRFSGVDGSEMMLKMAEGTGLYQGLQLCSLGEEPLPVQPGLFDVVVIVGALSVGQVPVSVIPELCRATKAGGCVCMTTRSNPDNLDYKSALEKEMKALEEEAAWTCEGVTEVQQWERAVSEHEDGYISGAVYLYRKL
ncbi:methyltransferase-like protein 27 isoform X1 [Synchiropus splendidus]|uniref:methyltransferase-like protein 27 isoform X1 n=2 Tax=Synchiropus splendidus TaxID=270530 RepID=UPI00237EB367|nr:methyltransferase-like protein 27 isoform X1 [Synchiropus splendidus]